MTNRIDRPATMLAALGILALLVGGCGRGGPPLAAVSGVVALDGKPLSQGRVLFVAERGQGANGTIDEQGRFTLATDGRPGASVGRHRVAVVSTREVPPSPGETLAGAEWLIPQHYGNPDQSGLVFDVQEDTHNIRIELSTQAQGKIVKE
ncbi:MAG: hypothetical protein JW719_06675 [Pirellulales bacterium]|nr:hypothetical protein [Pirellulales bacterium]